MHPVSEVPFFIQISSFKIPTKFHCQTRSKPGGLPVQQSVGILHYSGTSPHAPFFHGLVGFRCAVME